MYEYVLNNEQEEIQVNKEILIELPKPLDMPYPPPLNEALPEELYNKYILKLPDVIYSYYSINNFNDREHNLM